ncbi:unnamed protein product [Heterobilharzia americana]|nr:unnamed protein product [Heterobilharzia americana]
MPKGQSNVSLKSLCSEITEGSLLEAKDSYGNWYPVKVLNVDGDKVHVHFCNWSSRYDAWYPIDSSFLRVLKRNFVQGTTKQDKSDSYNRSMDKGSKGSEVCDIHFEVGSYVMAAWRNDFEYLAEVLAHRQRHGTKAEYRLRYIWDRVIEWTPINRLRKATQYEVDYVLKFCKEHNTSTNRLPNQPDSQQSCSSGDSEIGIPRTKRIRTTLSESKSDRSSDPELPRYRSRSTRASTSSSCIVDDKKSPHPTLYDGIVEQDGMVYEKSVFQFHEACRKRRELKRKDIEEKGAFPHSFDRSVSMDQTDHQVTLNPVPPEVSASGSLKAEDCVSKSTINVSSLSSSIPPYQKSDEVDETKSAEKACRTSVDSSNSLKSSTKCDVKNIQRTRRHLAQKKEVEIKVPHVNTSPEITSKIPPKSAAPVVYPCPYCSRQLRNSKLLDAHIVNYHKSVSNSTKSASFRGNGVYQNRCLSWKSHPNFSPFFRQISKGKLSESCSDASSVTKFTRLLSCYRCNSRAYVTERSLILFSVHIVFVGCIVRVMDYHSAVNHLWK